MELLAGGREGLRSAKLKVPELVLGSKKGDEKQESHQNILARPKKLVWKFDHFRLR